MSTSATPALLNFSSAADRDLVASAALGLEGGFEELVRRYQRPISGYVYRMVGDYEAALDLTQEIFIKIYGSLSRYRPEFKFSTWIYKIAHNAAIDHLRRNTGRERSLINGTENDNYDLPLESEAPSPEQQSEREERRLEIETVVRSLPTAYRELVVFAPLAGSDLRGNCRRYGLTPGYCQESSVSCSRNDATAVSE